MPLKQACLVLLKSGVCQLLKVAAFICDGALFNNGPRRSLVLQPVLQVSNDARSD